MNRTNPEYGFFALESFSLPSTAVGGTSEAAIEIQILEDQGINPFPIYGFWRDGYCAVAAGSHWILAARITGTQTLFALVFPSEGEAIAAYRMAAQWIRQ